MPVDARSIVREVLSPRRADAIWSARYEKALPISFNDFELSAILPAVFYMFRFGHRRGQGKFLSAFAPECLSGRERKRSVTIDRIARELTSDIDLSLRGFDGGVGVAILGDLLLCFELENVKHDLGRNKQVQRVAPSHYMASWVDLPETVAHLRYVPEMVVAMLANQDGDYVQQTNRRESTWFAVANVPSKVVDSTSGRSDGRKADSRNLLLEAFSRGITPRAHVSDQAPESFDERDDSVGLDQLLMIRLAQKLETAPDKLRGENSRISNQRPIAQRAAEHFSEDIRRFVRSYSGVIPRHVFVDLLESGIATGMTAILTSVIEILFAWSDNGAVPPKHTQSPAGLFVDCSKGSNRLLRGLAERSMDDLMRRIERVPVILMMLRLLDYQARFSREIKNEGVRTRPYATEWLDLLGALLHGRHPEAQFIHRTMDGTCEELAEAFRDTQSDAATALEDSQVEPNPIRRLALALTPLLGSMARVNTISMLDSTLHIDRPNGLAQKRKTSIGTGGARRQRDVRSLIFSESVLDYLVHVLLLPSGKASGIRCISLQDFLIRIRKRFGFYVDVSPPGMPISNELLLANRAILERRLRDLGLLAGVNDAEAMKRMQPRFIPESREEI